MTKKQKEQHRSPFDQIYGIFCFSFFNVDGFINIQFVRD